MQVLGKHVDQVIRRVTNTRQGVAADHERHSSSVFETTDQCDPEVYPGDTRIITGSGRQLCVSITRTPLIQDKPSSLPVADSDTGDRRNGTVLLLRDVSAERKLTAELEFKASHDALTTLANRAKFEQVLCALFDSAAPACRGHALCYIDLDRFKEINDTCGHVAGDELLLKLSAALKTKIREGDLLARLGGDEFAIVICDLDAAAAESVAKRVYLYLQSYYFEYCGTFYPVRASIGFVHFNPTKNSIADVISTADAACYAAKKDGRNTLHVREVAIAADSAAGREVRWLPRLQSALAENKFTLFAQPVVDLSRDNLTFGYEFLVRMIGDNGELISPGHFLPSAERFNLVCEIDRWVIQESLRQMSDMPESFCGTVLFINLSVQSVKSDAFREFLAKLLVDYPDECPRLCFEIAENIALNYFSETVSLVKMLRDAGCMSALDDVGLALSSFSMLVDVGVDYLKIDGQFSARLGTDENAVRLLKSVLAFACAAGYTVIAEHIETEDAIRCLRDEGVQLGQGYATGQPVSLASLRQSGSPDEVDSHKPAGKRAA